MFYLCLRKESSHKTKTLKKNTSQITGVQEMSWFVDVAFLRFTVYFSRAIKGTHNWVILMYVLFHNQSE